MKTKRKLEKIFKGIANHRRIEILYLVSKNPNLSIAEISDILRANFKTIHEHIRKMHLAGLVYKNSRGPTVQTTLSPLGKTFLDFCRKLERKI